MIYYLQNIMSLSPRSHPNRARCVQLLGNWRLLRSTLLQQQDDLKQSVLHFTDAIFRSLPQDTCPPFLNVVQIFFFLTIAICFRAEASGQPEDVMCCMMYLRYLRGQWHEVPIRAPYSVTGTLVLALRVRVALELGDVYQDIEEMADLCNELLNSDIVTMSLIKPTMGFARAVRAHRMRTFRAHVLPESVFGCLRKAILRLPDNLDLQEVFIALAESLCDRFGMTLLEDDYREGMAVVNKIIAFGGPGARSPHHSSALSLVNHFSIAQAAVHGKPEHLEQAISCIRNCLDETSSLEDPDRPQLIESLSFLNGLRSMGTSAMTDIQIILPNSSESAEHPSFPALIASLPDLDDIESLPMTTLIKYVNAINPDAVGRLTDIADIKDGIKYCQQLLTSHPNFVFAYLARISLGRLFYSAFECTDEIEYLNKAISTIRDSINAKVLPLLRIVLNIDFMSCLSTRFNLFHRREDLNELVQAFEMAVKHQHLEPIIRFQISCEWAWSSRLFDHPSTSTAYSCAISSMQASLTFAPTLDRKHSRLVALPDRFKTLPLDYASYQIRAGRLKQAIETLERGRALLWSEMRGLRSSIDQIRLADPSLAQKFAGLNRDLEALTLATSSDNNIISGASVPGTDPSYHTLIQRRKLVDDREELISQIQTLPGLDTFLKPLSFDILRSAACRGPVVIINHCRWRSDILILHQNSLPSLIPTHNDFYARANKLQDQLLEERKKGLYSDEYEDTLRFVLKELYDLVGRPLIKRLNELNIPEQSRVWLCPTSVFCSLPLHAMGPIPSDTGSSRYFLDLYIPSYTPSLSALIESRKPGSQAIGKPSILLVAQPDKEMPMAFKEMKAVENVDTQVTTLFSAKAKPAAVLTNLRDHQFAHIVCHGVLEPGKPFEASFKLYKGKRLHLLDIVQSQLPDAEFAFLSACHTAELTVESIADEAIHLAAAVQFCGFRSVVGTMWAMADIDGWDLARSFYGSVFSDETKDGHYYERTAGALRDAVKELRRKEGISLERWVNFVHYGA